MLLAASYLFYAAWDWRFLSLVLISTTLDYLCGIKIDKATDFKVKKRILLLSIIGNLSILGLFKYFNFFAYNLQALINLFGYPFEPRIFHIILPIGISFYTFKTMTYTIGIYWGQIKPTRQYFDYALFVAFFPALLSGPIDRADNLLPQILSPRKLSLDQFYKGSYLILLGLFQKMFVADNIAAIVDPVYSSTAPYQGAAVLLAMYAYVFQLYYDFAGYSNIAIGLGMVMGFDMINNFNLPLFATNVADFWRRWHISLSTWVRDYIYTPLFLGFRNLNGNLRLYVTLLVTMLLLGIWHGAAWNFVIFGIYYGVHLVLYYMISPIIKKHVSSKTWISENVLLISSFVFMFHVTAVGFLLFRAESLSQIYNMLYSLLFNFNVSDISWTTVKVIMAYSSIVLFIEVCQYRKNDLMIILKWNTLARASLYFVCFYLIIFFSVKGGKEFVYFQF